LDEHDDDCFRVAEPADEDDRGHRQVPRISSLCDAFIAINASRSAEYVHALNDRPGPCASSARSLSTTRVITDPGLLSRGSRVRVAAGAPFPKDFASLDCEEIPRRTQIEQSDQSREIAPTADFLSKLCDRIFRIVAKIAKNACEFRPGIPEVALRISR